MRVFGQRDAIVRIVVPRIGELMNVSRITTDGDSLNRRCVFDDFLFLRMPWAEFVSATRSRRHESREIPSSAWEGRQAGP